MLSQGRPTILLVEDTPSLARVYRAYLRDEDCQIVHAETGAAALAAIEGHVPSVVLLDLNLPDMPGMEILRRITERRIPTVVIVITAHSSVNIAVEAMRNGAIDFLAKPFTAERLVTTVRNALVRQRLAGMVETYQETFARDRFVGFIGASLAMQTVYRIIESAAPSRATVLITGESGTGKELCAEAIHQLSPRRDRAFVPINCAAIPKGLIESELFGHVKGAFTGAVTDRPGAAACADGGTLFLDEIGELDLDLQSKLLRFIQSGTYTRVGSNREETTDIRFVCATNRDPFAEVKAGRFREDLYYRLNVVPIQLPALREREGDAVLLARAFTERYAREEGKKFRRLSAECEDAIAAYDWPGNVRELQNVVRRAIVLNDAEELDVAMLPPAVRAAAGQPGRRAATPPPAPTANARAGDQIKPLWLVEKEAIDCAIDACAGNIPKAAALLDVSPSTIYRKMQRWQEEGRT